MKFKIKVMMILDVEPVAPWTLEEVACDAVRHIIDEGFHPQHLEDWTFLDVTPIPEEIKP